MEESAVAVVKKEHSHLNFVSSSAAGSTKAEDCVMRSPQFATAAPPMCYVCAFNAAVAFGANLCVLSPLHSSPLARHYSASVSYAVSHNRNVFFFSWFVRPCSFKQANSNSSQQASCSPKHLSNVKWWFIWWRLLNNLNIPGCFFHLNIHWKLELKHVHSDKSFSLRDSFQLSYSDNCCH